jgi:hypothetical protein
MVPYSIEKKHTKAHKKSNQKSGCIDDARIYVHAKFGI